MTTYEVKWRYFSHYEDESEDLEEFVTETYEAESEEALDQELEEDMDWDDECVINFDAKSDAIETGREHISTNGVLSEWA